ncbi:Ppx/GppA phosphatase family protein [Chitinilyticum piscinae]|uniref:Ppx/GppA family phosphatase n=1 Tax=Chitinilyticum piscinae TaxID=2866724 RepID=A0A8J7FJI4_9NEIS|nr:Ppx/GppA phosphatase family protein [Chitinilyticum piscinae]MBE9609017.1 Ppx/GppA family phosphatase [Chitinilyticum piscinae]
MSDSPVIAAVDLGSNSFRLQVARVVDGEVFPLETRKETVRLGAGLDRTGRLTPAAQAELIEALGRFGEVLAHFQPACVRAVATNTFRVASNRQDFLPAAEAALGYPIDIINGREEARLIYIGAAHSLPSTRERRLVLDIGGGSTELIIGSGLRAYVTESVQLGCVAWSMRYFPDGIINAERLAAAELAARGTLLPLVPEFRADQWHRAVGTSGTARSLSDLLELNGFSRMGITREGLDRLREIMLGAGHIDAIQLHGLRPDRRPVLPGGFAIMNAAFGMFGIERMGVTYGALRDGILYDLMARAASQDVRDRTVANFVRRFQADVGQSERVRLLAEDIFGHFRPGSPEILHRLGMAAALHEIGRAIAHHDYYRHTAYILAWSDMLGFSEREQAWLSWLTGSQSGPLPELARSSPDDRAALLALRLAVLLARARSDCVWPDGWRCGAGEDGRHYELALPEAWLNDAPLIVQALHEEQALWQTIGITLTVPALGL